MSMLVGGFSRQCSGLDRIIGIWDFFEAISDIGRKDVKRPLFSISYRPHSRVRSVSY